jgi:hypothetical protein
MSLPDASYTSSDSTAEAIAPSDPSVPALTGSSVSTASGYAHVKVSSVPALDPLVDALAGSAPSEAPAASAAPPAAAATSSFRLLSGVADASS